MISCDFLINSFVEIKVVAVKPSAPKKVKLAKPKNGVQFTQAEFFQSLNEACGLESRKQAKEVFEGFAGMLQSALKKGYKVPLPGIGKIQVRQSKCVLLRAKRSRMLFSNSF